MELFSKIKKIATEAAIKMAKEGKDVLPIGKDGMVIVRDGSEEFVKRERANQIPLGTINHNSANFIVFLK